MEPIPDIDPVETQEWLDSLDSVLASEGTERAHYLLERLVEKARRSGAYLPYSAGGFVILDIADKSQPKLVSDLPFSPPSEACDDEVAARYRDHVPE